MRLRRTIGTPDEGPAQIKPAQVGVSEQKTAPVSSDVNPSSPLPFRAKAPAASAVLPPKPASARPAKAAPSARPEDRPPWERNPGAFQPLETLQEKVPAPGTADVPPWEREGSAFQPLETLGASAAPVPTGVAYKDEFGNQYDDVFQAYHMENARENYQRLLDKGLTGGMDPEAEDRIMRPWAYKEYTDPSQPGAFFRSGAGYFNEQAGYYLMSVADLIPAMSRGMAHATAAIVEGGNKAASKLTGTDAALGPKQKKIIDTMIEASEHPWLTWTRDMKERVASDLAARSLEEGGKAGRVVSDINNVIFDTVEQLAVLKGAGAAYGGGAGVSGNLLKQTGQKLAHAHKIAAFRYLTTEGDPNSDIPIWKQKADSYLLTSAYMSTPALSGWMSTPAGAKVVDFALNTLVSLKGKVYRDAIEQAGQRAVNEGRPEDAAFEKALAAAQVFGMDVVFSAITKPHQRSGFPAIPEEVRQAFDDSVGGRRAFYAQQERDMVNKQREMIRRMKAGDAEARDWVRVNMAGVPQEVIDRERGNQPEQTPVKKDASPSAETPVAPPATPAPQPKPAPPVETIGEGAPALRVKATAQDGTVLGEVLADAKSEAKAIKQLRKAHPGAYLIQAEELAAKDGLSAEASAKAEDPDGWPEPGKIKVYRGRGQTETDGRIRFFTTDPNGAQEYAEMRGESGQVVEAEVEINNPASRDDVIAAAKAVGATVEDVKKSSKHPETGIGFSGENELDYLYVPEVVEELKKRGFDGLIAGDDLMRDSIVAVVPFSAQPGAEADSGDASPAPPANGNTEVDTPQRSSEQPAPRKPKAESPKPDPSNIYLRMPIDRVRADAAKGIALAKEALKARDRKSEIGGRKTDDGQNALPIAAEKNKEVQHEDEPEYIELPQEDRSEGVGVSDAPAPVAKKKRKRTAAQRKNDAELKRKMQPVDTALAEFRKLHPYIKAPKKTDAVYTELMGLSAKEPGAVARRFFRQNPALSSYDQILDEAHAQIPHIITEDDLGEPSALAKIYGFRLETVGEMEAREAQEWDDRAAAEASAQFEAQFMLYIEDEMLPPSAIREEHPAEWSRALERAGVDESALIDTEAPIADEEIEVAAGFQPLEKPAEAGTTNLEKVPAAPSAIKGVAPSGQTELLGQDEGGLKLVGETVKQKAAPADQGPEMFSGAETRGRALDDLDAKGFGALNKVAIRENIDLKRGGVDLSKLGAAKMREMIRSERLKKATALTPKASSLTPSLSWSQLSAMKRNGLRKLAEQVGVSKSGKNIELQRRIAEKIGGEVENDMFAARLAEAGKQTDTNPTAAQAAAENYKAGRIRYRGQMISIENPKGSVRKGQDADGREWSRKMVNTYGRIRGTVGADGDHVDVFFDDESPISDTVYIINQTDAQGRFDEEKVMFGFESEAEARAAYLANYEKGWNRISSIEEMKWDDFSDLITDLEAYRLHLEAKKTTKKGQEAGDGSSTAQNLAAGERARPAGQAAGPGAVEPDGAGTRNGNRPDVGADERSGDSPAGDPGVSSGADALRGARGDQPGGTQVAEPGTAAGTAGGAGPQRGADAGGAGMQPESGRVGDIVRDSAERQSDGAGAADSLPVAQGAAAALKQRVAQQKKAEAVPAKAGDAANIRETLPVLFTEQHDDVIHGENRIVVEDKHGVLYTNGTGTGKTFTGLGIVKRFQKMGKGEILILTPKASKNRDWKHDAELLGIEAQVLESTTDGGQGVTITTYANFYQNRALAQRDFDLVVYDESHKLDASQQQGSTVYSMQHKAITKHPNYLWYLAQQRSPKWLAYQQRLDTLAGQVEQKHLGQEVPSPDPLLEQAYDLVFSDLGTIFDGPKKDRAQAIRNKVRTAFDTQRESELKELADAARAEISAIENELKTAPRGKAVFLSASPFAYHVSLDYAEGYLFDYEQVDNTGIYNVATGLDKLLQDNFGYQMRNGKLNKPDAEVNVDLMERMFYEKLKEEGAVRGRQLDVPVDYSRHFIDISVSKQGALLNNAFATLYSGDNGYDQLRQYVQGIYTFQYINYMMESMKAAEAVKRARKHIDLGRKVVLFHSYKKPTKDFAQNPRPFRFRKMDETQGYWKERQAAKKFNAELKRFYEAVPGIETVRWKFPDPLDLFAKEFGDEAVFVNGNVPAGKRSKNIAAFNDKDGPKVIVMQIDAGKEGTSLHDTEGDMPRAVINIGLPYKPMDLIQSEGRTYRLGSQSNAVYEYLKLGLNFEQVAFNQKISTRSRTAENLALGNLARDMEQVLKDGYLNSTAEEPHLEQGTGGKERDKRVLSGEVNSFDYAKTFYFAKQKRNSRTKAREGADYFATPEPVGLKMVEWAGARSGERMLEPSAGDGAIGRWFPEYTKNTFVEPSYELMTKLQTNVSGSHNRFETGRFEELYIGNKYNAIVMNPPFGAGGRTAIDHLAKAFNHLKDGGRVVALIPEGPSADKKFDKWYESPAAEHAYMAGNIHLPNITFERAGTQVKTRIVIIDKQSNPADAQQTRELSLESAEKISELFDRIEEISFEPPSVPTPVVKKTEDGRQRTEELARGLTSSRDFVLPDRRFSVSETPERAKYRAAQPVVLSGEEMDVPHTAYLRAAKWAEKHGQTGTFQNADTGWDVIVTRNRLKKALHRGAARDKVKMLAGIRSMIERAVYLESDPEYKPKTISHFFAVPVQVAGKEYAVGFVIHEDTKSGKRYYTHELVEEKDLKGAVPEHGENPEAPRGQVRTVLHKHLGVNPDDVRRFSVSDALGFYSPLERAVEGFKQETFTPDQLAGMVRKAPGVKAEELEDIGFYDWLEGTDGRVTKAEAIAFIENNGPQIREVVKGFTEDQRATSAERLEAAGYIIEDDGSISRENEGGDLEQVDPWNLPDELVQDAQIVTGSEEGFATARVEEAENSTKFGQWQLPGGENYREVLLTLPDRSPEAPSYSEWFKQKGYDESQRPFKASEYQKEFPPKDQTQYKSSHWNEPNVLAHVRLNDRTGPNGEKILFVEEIQSDWHQAGRKKGYEGESDIDQQIAIAKRRLDKAARAYNEWFESIPTEQAADMPLSEIQANPLAAAQREANTRYTDLLRQKTEGVPNAPFKKSWAMLAFKRVLRMAAEQGYDSVAWTPGEVHTDRWGTEQIAWEKQADGTFLVHAKSQHGGVAGGIDIEAEALARDLIKESSAPVASEAELKETISPALTEGQDLNALARKLWARMQSEDSGVSHPRKEGFEGFYDKILPKAVQKYVKKMGGKVGTIDLTADGVPIVELTESEREEYGNLIRRDNLTNGGLDSFEVARLKELDAKVEGLKGTEVWSLPITEQMRESVMQGQPRFAMAGVNAATAGRTDVAEQMERAGADRTTIWKETGWWRGPDGKWRFEVDDSRSKVLTRDEFAEKRRAAAQRKMSELYEKYLPVALRATVTEEKNQYGTMYKIVHDPGGSEHSGAFGKTKEEAVKNLIDHLSRKDPSAAEFADAWSPYSLPMPKKLRDIFSNYELEQAYPQIMEYEIVYPSLVDQGGYHGSFDGKKTFAVDYDIGNDPQRLKSVLMHEIQHAIQKLEGFAGGGNLTEVLVDPAGLTPDLSEIKTDLVKAALADSGRLGVLTRKKYAEGLRGEELNEQERLYKNHPLYKKLQTAIETLRSGRSNYDVYRSLGGEVEARLVQRRLNMDPVEREKTPPWQTLETMLREEGLLKDGMSIDDLMINRDAAAKEKIDSLRSGLRKAAATDKEMSYGTETGDDTGGNQGGLRRNGRAGLGERAEGETVQRAGRAASDNQSAAGRGIQQYDSPLGAEARRRVDAEKSRRNALSAGAQRTLDKRVVDDLNTFEPDYDRIEADGLLEKAPMGQLIVPVKTKEINAFVSSDGKTIFVSTSKLDPEMTYEQARDHEIAHTLENAAGSAADAVRALADQVDENTPEFRAYHAVLSRRLSPAYADKWTASEITADFTAGVKSHYGIELAGAFGANLKAAINTAGMLRLALRQAVGKRKGFAGFQSLEKNVPRVGNGRFSIAPPTDSEAFKAWFGDSKVVDADGKPLVVYHGTGSRQINVFRDELIGKNSGNEGHYGRGFYFSTDRSEAATYGNNILPVYVKIQNPFYGTDAQLEELRSVGIDWIDEQTDLSLDYDSLRTALEQVDPVAATLLKLIHERGYSAGWSEFLEEYSVDSAKVDLNDVSDLYEDGVMAHGISDAVFNVLKQFGIRDDVKTNKGFYYRQSLHWITDLGNRAAEVSDALVRLGYDGVMVGSEVVAFSPTQIKSATGNNGQYDPNNPDIRFSVSDQSVIPQKLAAVETLVKAFEERKGKYTKPSAAIMQKRLAALEKALGVRGEALGDGANNLEPTTDNPKASALADFAKRSLPENFRWRLKGTLTRLANDPKVGMDEFYRAALNKTRALVEEIGILASDPQAKVEGGNIQSPQLDAMTAALKDIIAKNEEDPRPVTESLKAEFEGEAITDPVLKPFVESLNRSIQKTRSKATIRLVEQGKKAKMGGFLDVERAFEKLQEQTGIPFWNLYRRIFFIDRDVDFFTKQDVEGVFQGLENNDGKPAKVEDIIYDPRGEQRIIMYLDTGIVAPDLTDFELDVAERVKALYKEWEPFVKRAAHLAWMRTGTMPGKGTPAIMKEGAEIRARYGEDSPEYEEWIDKQDFGVRTFYSPKKHEAALKVMMEEKRNFGRGFTKRRKGPAKSKSLIGGLYSYIRNARRVRDLEPHLKQLEALFDENHRLVDSGIVDRFFNNLYGNRIKLDGWQRLILKGTGRFFRVRIPQAVLRWSLRNKFQPTTNVVPRVFSPFDPLFWKHLRRIWSPFSGARVGTAQKYIQQKIRANDKLATYFHRYVSSLDAARTEKFLLEMTKYEEIAKLGQGFMHIYDAIGKGYTWSDMDNRAQTFIYGFEAGIDALARYRKKPTRSNWNRFLDITGMIYAPKTEQVELANLVDQGRDDDAVYLAAHRLADATQFRYVRSERGLGWQEPGKGMHTGMPIATYWKGTMQMLGDDFSALNDFMKSPDRRSARRARKALAHLAVWYLISLIVNRIYEELYDVDRGAYGTNTLFYVPGGPVFGHLIEVADAFRQAWGDEKGADYKATLAIHSGLDFYVPLYHLLNKALTPSVETGDGTRMTEAYFKLPMEARRVIKEKIAEYTGSETPRDTRRWVELKAGEQMQRILLSGARPTDKQKLADLYEKWLDEKDFSAKKRAGKRLLEAFRKYPLSTKRSFRRDKPKPRDIRSIRRDVPSIHRDLLEARRREHKNR